MITQINVDGFKSLKEFELNFVSGLNILVGPNGAGKTNIVSFFEFLANLMQTDASEATSQIGGAGSIFRRIGENYERIIDATIKGCVGINPDPETEKGANNAKYCLYEYSFTLIFPEAADGIFFKAQNLKLLRRKEFTNHNIIHKTQKWGLDITVNHQANGASKITINEFTDSVFDSPYYPSSPQKKGHFKISDIISTLISGGSISLPNALARFVPLL